MARFLTEGGREASGRAGQAAAERAVTFVLPGMVVGLGAGTTAHYAVLRIAELVTRGQLAGLACVPCSRAVGEVATRLGLPLTTLEERPIVDLTIDGADEVDPHLELIKGGGGALLHEKIVAQASSREIIVVDGSKSSPMLGTRCRVPVEVVAFGWRTQAHYLESLGARVHVREGQDNTPFRTDQGNLILDCEFGPISEPRHLAGLLAARAGIVEHGLFLGLASDLIIADASGTRHLTRPPRRTP